MKKKNERKNEKNEMNEMKNEKNEKKNEKNDKMGVGVDDFEELLGSHKLDV